MDFIKEFEELKRSVPRAALFNIKSENSEYTSYAIGNKNCYRCMGADYNQDCYYGYWIYTNKDAIDCSYLYDTEIAYECVDVKRSYSMYYSQDCSDCRDLFLCYDCVGSNDSFGCVGLRRKEYHIFNKKYSKEEYLEKVAQLRVAWHTREDREEILRNFEEVKMNTPHVYMHQLDAEFSSGDYIYNARNSLYSFDVRRCEDSQHLYNTFDLKNCGDCSYVRDGELLYECVSCFGINFNYCYVCWGGVNMDFSELCFNCSDCIGCIGLKNKQFHILNKPYSEEEYKKVAPELKAQLREQGLYSGRLPEVFWQG